jgi:hypothetical protein
VGGLDQANLVVHSIIVIIPCVTEWVSFLIESSVPAI